MEVCFNCGSRQNITRDHIPPKGFFNAPIPTNLITVPCCESCNSSFSNDDEAFRAFVTSVWNRNQAGADVWSKKVVKRLNSGTGKLKKNMIQHIVTINPVMTPAGVSDKRIDFPQERGNRFLIRITKGLIRYLYPKLDYSEAKFFVKQLEIDQHIVDNVLSNLVFDQRGSGIFRFWRGFITLGAVDSTWVFQFYEGLMFCVVVNPQNFPEPLNQALPN